MYSDQENFSLQSYSSVQASYQQQWSFLDQLRYRIHLQRVQDNERSSGTGGIFWDLTSVLLVVTFGRRSKGFQIRQLGSRHAR